MCTYQFSTETLLLPTNIGVSIYLETNGVVLRVCRVTGDTGYFLIPHALPLRE